MDADALSLFGLITHLEKNSQPWENVAIVVYFLQKVNMKLTAHASYLTRIEAPHYRTLNNKNDIVKKQLTLDNLFYNSNRVINLDTIPLEQMAAKTHFEKYNLNYPVSINKSGRFVKIKDDDI